MKFLCIGESCMEFTCPIDSALTEGSKLDISEYQENGGGHAGNVAYLLGKWGSEVYIASMMGADDFASKIKKDYETINIKTEYIETSFDKKTALSVVLFNKENKDTTVVNVANNLQLKKYSFLVEPDIIISDGYDFQATRSAFDKFNAAKRVLLVNKVNNNVLELARYANYIIFNQKAAKAITNIELEFTDSSTLVNTYNKLKQRYDGAEIVVTLGEKGCIYSVQNQVKVLPVVKYDVVDTYGAGDVFAGAFCYGISKNFDIEKSIMYATIAASMSVTKMTARLSIPALTEVSSYYDNKMAATKESAPVNETPVENANVINMNTASVETPVNNVSDNVNVTPVETPVNNTPSPVNATPVENQVNINEVPNTPIVEVNNDNTQNPNA